MERASNVYIFNRKKFYYLLFIIFLFGIVWSVFFSYKECVNLECFNSHLESCDRARFIGGTDMIFEYAIKGESDFGCEIGIQLLQGSLNDQDSIKLENQKMTCILPKGVVMAPESDIGNCHGLLKEGLQDLVIKKLHTYLVQNLGKLNLEVLDIPA
ncbi:MAG: hypothetical protein OEL89_01705 [Candidatus Peregrinibacteria bacterium]|nr:hypothetical protein [Candidatus Peregrinibacteria bacterium]